MKKRYIVSSLALATLSIASIAYAQDASVGTATAVPAVTTTNVQPGVPQMQGVPGVAPRLTPLQIQKLEEQKRLREVNAEERKEIRENVKEIRKDVKEVRKDVRENIKDIRANATSTEARESAREKIEEERKKLDEKREEARKKAGIERAKAVIKRLDRQVAEMHNLANRIAERVAEFKARGMDTSKTEIALADARTKIVIAKDKVTAIITAIEGFLASSSTTATSTNVNDALKMAAPQVREAEKAIRDADKALRATLKARPTRPAAVPVPPVTSTTTSTTGATTTQGTTATQ